MFWFGMVHESDDTSIQPRYESTTEPRQTRTHKTTLEQRAFPSLYSRRDAEKRRAHPLASV